MRELMIRIRFTSPCLGNRRTYYTVFTVEGKRKRRPLFLFIRNPDRKVTFLQTWWQRNIKKAAETLCRYQKDVTDIRFAPEVDGQPRKLPDGAFKRYYDKDKFSPHEAFHAGDEVGISCLVPSNISDDGMWRLMDLAGKYYGISPYEPINYGLFNVESITRRGGAVVATPDDITVPSEATKTTT